MGYSLDKRIFKFFSGSPCECSMILCIIEDLRLPSLSCQRIKLFWLLNFWFITTYDLIGLIVV